MKTILPFFKCLELVVGTVLEGTSSFIILVFKLAKDVINMVILRSEEQKNRDRSLVLQSAIEINLIVQ